MRLELRLPIKFLKNGSFFFDNYGYEFQIVDTIPVIVDGKQLKTKPEEGLVFSYNGKNEYAVNNENTTVIIKLDSDDLERLSFYAEEIANKEKFFHDFH